LTIIPTSVCTATAYVRFEAAEVVDLVRAGQVRSGSPKGNSIFYQVKMAASRLTTTATRKASKDVISCLSPSQNQQRRSLFGFGRKTKPANKPPSPPPRPILSQNNLFHPLSSSPIPSLREKSERIKKQAFCPVSLVKYGQRKHVAYDCPTCGWPTHASRQMWEEDPEKEKYWARLREANEDEHDLRSGRLIKEFELPGG
jgi:splicing suppressor protein 51